MKSEIQIKQTDKKLNMNLRLAEGYEIRSILLRNPFIESIKKYPVQVEGEEFVFSIGLQDMISDLYVDSSLYENSETVHSEEEEEEADDEETQVKNYWYWYAEVIVDPERSPEALAEKVKEKALPLEEADPAKDWMIEGSIFKKNVRLGKFKNTSIEGMNIVEHDDHTLLTYINKHKYFVTAVDEPVKGKVKLQIERLKTKNNKVEIEGRLNTGFFPIDNSRIILKSRTSTREYQLDVEMQKNEETFRRKFGKSLYLFSAEINFDHLLPDEKDVYDLFIEADIPFSLEPVRIRMGRPTFRAKHFFSEISGKSEEGVLLINPYFTLYKSNLSFEVFPFLKENYRYLKKARRFPRIKQLLNRKKDVWLVGERPYKAQDTGFHFFKYMRENHPEKNVYYVISKDSPEYKNVEPLGNVLEFGSKEHIWNVIIATKIFSSHHSNYLFPLRTKSFDKIIKATRIFLQHGVMGVKNMTNLYGVNTPHFSTDLFVTSSEYEKSYIAGDFGYDEKDIIVAGLPRFDALFKEDIRVKRQVLIIPTWRDWIQNIDSFLESEYYDRYFNLLNNKELLRHSKENNYELVFCLHPNMQVFSSYFDDAPVRIIYQGEVDVQKLLKESALLITDYSSVAFDFSFLHKPVIYYQFDRPKFIGKKGSHLDLINDLPGEIVEDEQDLLATVKNYVSNKFAMKDEYKEKANKFIEFRDTNSSRRIYEAALQYEKKSSVINDLMNNEMLEDLYKKFRKSKYYFPTMKKAYTLMRLILPVNKKKVFFESGIGKNFSDSPKEIFEVLQQEERDYEYIWAYNKNLNHNYKNTKIIKRLSPSYYYHLATSRYWVNNQNFPTYIKKRRSTKYLQTWHGTPLKRMLHDIDEIQGRDETYLSRVTSAVKRWDYLVSPSQYATENFRSAFKYTGPVLEEGYPRNDVFFKEEALSKADELRERLDIAPDKKILLYAMTFRDNQTAGSKFTMDLPIDFQKFHETLGDEYVLLIRMHVVVSNKVKIPEEYRESIKNVSSYPDIQELMILSDALITDYSSVFFDYLNTDKPVLFYTYDLEEYRDKLRGFYMDFEKDAPGPLCVEEEALYDAISDLPKVKEEYRGQYEQAKERFCYLDDGLAAKRIADKVFK